MAGTMAQQKFTNLRRRLDQLGYKQPLGVDSLPLVERLFADLIHTTDSLKKAKLKGRSSSPGGTVEEVEAQIEPYKNDNARLLKENGELHLRVIRQKEELDLKMADLKTALRKLEHENNDLRFLNNQYVHKVRGLERETKEKSDRILKLQEKNFHAVVQTPGGKRKNIPFRRQRLTVDSTVPSSGLHTPPVVSPRDDLFVADLLKVADARVDELQGANSELLDQNEIFKNKVQNFRKQVEARDSEIDRLNRLMEGGRPHDVVALDARNRGNEKLISHLNIQIDYLQQKNRDLERRLEEARVVEAAARRQNVDSEMKQSQLEAELRDVDRRAKRLEVDKETVVQVADQELHDARSDLERSRQDLEALGSEQARLRAENRRLEEEQQTARLDLGRQTSEMEKLELLVDRVQGDKKKLSNRVTKLCNNEKQLVLEIDRLKQRRAPPPSRRGKSKSPNRFDALIKGIEEERDYWRAEVETLQDILRQRSGSSPAALRASPTLRSGPGGRRYRSPSPTRSGLKQGRSQSSHIHSTPKSGNRGRSPVKADRSSQYETIIRALEEERDHYKREYTLQRSLKHSVESPRGLKLPSPSHSGGKAGGEEVGELRKVMRERDELQGLLDKFERHMAEIQANVKVLSSERDRMTHLYHEARDELQQARRQILTSPKSPKSSLAAQTVLRRVEGERDEAVCELRSAVSERDTLRERLRIITEQNVNERARLEQQVEDMSQQLHSVTANKNDAEQALAHIRTRCRDFEEEVKLQGMRVSECQEEIAKARAAASHTRMVADETERSLHDTQQRLMLREGDVRNLEEKCLSLEDKLREAHRLNDCFRDEVNQLRQTISSLDREKDGLQAAVDEKTEQCVSLTGDLNDNDRLVTELKVKLQELERQVERGLESQRLQEREIRSLRRQVDEVGGELKGVGAAREAAVREGRRLEGDLESMTRENHSLHAELGDVLDERERLKDQVQDYVGEVRRVEHLLENKEEERTGLLEQYKALSQEAERCETQNHQLETETSSLRMELMGREADLRRLRDQKDAAERDVQEQVHTQRALEAQMTSMSRTLAGLEERIRQSDAEKYTLQQDLMAVRDLCAKLESGKDHVQRQLSSKTLEQEQTISQTEDLKEELSHLKSQLSSERHAVNNLESLISSSREKEFQSQLESQEHASEAQLMRDRLALNESKIESQAREISQLRARNAELDSDVERYRRQLTNERFERERAVQDARRQAETGPPLGRAHSGYSPSYSTSATPSKSPSKAGAELSSLTRQLTSGSELVKASLASGVSPKSRSGTVTPLGSDNSQWEEIETTGAQIMRRTPDKKPSDMGHR